LLDRFVPGWKRNFFQKKKNLDEMTSDFLNLSKTEKEEIAERLKTRYSFEDIYAKHKAVIKQAKLKEQ
ncbi:hypothetical protein ACFLRM_07220, partial [Acidobacteriota bacterium]